MARAPKSTIEPNSFDAALATLQQRIDHLQLQLAEQQKLATLGMITAVIAHEFNNILTPMISYARFALSDSADPALKDKALTKALSGAERAANICESLLGFARGDESRASDVARCVHETLSCLSREPAKDGITLSVQIEPDTWAAINAGHLQQVLMNLIVNARAAMIAGSRLRRLSISATRIKRGKIVQIDIADTGPGIPADVLPRIFEPFFSTKRADAHAPATQPTEEAVPRGGTGLGLTICQELVNAAGGAMRVASKEGQGTIFTIELPAAEKPQKDTDTQST